MKLNKLPYLAVLVFFSRSFTQENGPISDSLLFLQYAEKCSLEIRNNRPDLQADLDAARSLAEMGFFKDACEMLMPGQDSTRAGPAPVVPEPRKKNVEMEVGTGVDYYKYTDSDTSLYALYKDTLYGKADTAVFADENPADIFGEATLTWKPGEYYVKKISPYLRFSNLYSKEKLMLSMGDKAGNATEGKIGFTFLQSYTQYRDRAEKDSSDFLELQGILQLGWPFKGPGMTFKPLLQASVNSGQYRHNRPGYVSMRESDLSAGLNMTGSSLIAGIKMEAGRQKHPDLYDSLDALVLRPDLQLEYLWGPASISLSLDREITRTPAKKAADDQYTSADLSLLYNVNDRLGLNLSVLYEAEQTGFGDTFYSADDSLFSTPDTLINYSYSGSADTIVRDYRTVYEKYTVNGRRISFAPSMSIYWTKHFSTEFRYTYETGRYPKLDKVNKLTLEYPIPALEDPYHLNRAEIVLGWLADLLDAELSGAWENSVPDTKHPIEPENTALAVSISLNGNLTPSFTWDVSGAIERRIYADEAADHRKVLTKSMNLCLRKSFK